MTKQKIIEWFCVSCGRYKLCALKANCESCKELSDMLDGLKLSITGDVTKKLRGWLDNETGRPWLHVDDIEAELERIGGEK